MLKHADGSLWQICARPYQLLDSSWLKVWHWHQKSEPKLDPIIGDGTISAASRPLNALHMDVISDVEIL
jgi:hypothetical protein